MFTFILGVVIGFVASFYRAELLVFVKDAWSKVVGN